jgi:ribosomal protein L7/L12
MTDLAYLVNLASRKRREGCSLEEVLASLRSAGATIIDSLKVVREVEGVRLGRAKEIVDSSATWADMRESNEKLRSVAEQALEENDEPA